jgi:1,2-diacylglycerol 3-beta-glucosyltransferase
MDQYMQYPKVTIWVAARNEANNILRCMQHLNALEYPKEHLQILIGNDQSTDATAQIVAEFCIENPHFKLINVDKVINNQKGKANVLANLYEHSIGDYFLITDADVAVPPTWVGYFVSHFQENPKLGHQVGISSIVRKGPFSTLQSLDWLWALSLLKIASKFFIPLTGLGNNSAISREAYQASGGYASIPFSITEDFALFHSVVQKGYTFRNAWNIKAYAKTYSMDTLKDFLHQRKRWMVGALQCPWWVVVFLYVQALFPFLLLTLSLWGHTNWAGLLFLIKLSTQMLLLGPTLIILKEKKLFPWLIPYELYSWLWGFAMVIFYYLPIEIDWKGRHYSTK